MFYLKNLSQVGSAGLHESVTARSRFAKKPFRPSGALPKYVTDSDVRPATHSCWKHSTDLLLWKLLRWGQFFGFNFLTDDTHDVG